MKIGIFVVDVGESGGGLETYEVELIRALARIDTRNEYIIYTMSPAARAAVGVEQDNFTYRVLRPRSKWVSLPLSLPVQLVLDGVDFFHVTMVPPPFATKPYLMSVLCFSSWAHPEFFSQSVVKRLNFLLEIGLRKAKYLLCNSQNLLEDIHDRFRIPMERLAVTHLGVNESFTPQAPEETRRLLAQRYGIEGQYVLFIGKNQERKNALGAVRGFAEFCRSTTSDAKLVLVGRGPEESGPVFEAIRDEKLFDRVLRVPYVPYSDLPALYSGARMFVFPSFWEGFGLPVIESMACATPVITANVTALPEVAGDAALLVDPASDQQIADAMIRIETEPGLHARLVEKGLERKKLFSWDKCARETLAFYERMAEDARGRS